MDAVVIATPDHWHAYIAGYSLENGKDVYVEKPLTHNIEEAIKLKQLADRTKGVLQTGSQQRSQREFQVARDLLKNGVIGKVHSITTAFGPTAPPEYIFDKETVEPGLDWDMWCGPAPLKPYNSSLSPRGIHDFWPKWRMTRVFGGGQVTDIGAHHIDIAQWGLEVDETGPVEVKKSSNRGNDSFGAQLIYPGGIVLTHISHTEGEGIEFFGSDGSVKVSRGKFELKIDKKIVNRFWDSSVDKSTSLSRELHMVEKKFCSKEIKDKKGKVKDHYTDWLDCIKYRRNPICDATVGATSAISCHLLNLSYWKLSSFGWDPYDRKFLNGGDESWKTRQYRNDWKLT